MSSLHSLSTTRRSTRSRRSRAGLAVAAVVATVTPFAAACGSGFNSAALQVVPNAGAATVGSLKLNNVWVVVDPASGNAEVIGSLANTGNDDLAWPTVQVGGTSAQIQQPSGAGAGANPGASTSGVPAGQSVSFGLAGQPQIEVTGASLTPGNLTQVVFSFGSAGNVTISAQIQSNTGLFADYNPDSVNGASGGASASASANAFGGAGTSPSGNATSSASASASASPSASAS